MTCAPSTLGLTEVEALSISLLKEDDAVTDKPQYDEIPIPGKPDSPSALTPHEPPTPYPVHREPGTMPIPPATLEPQSPRPVVRDQTDTAEPSQAPPLDQSERDDLRSRPAISADLSREAIDYMRTDNASLICFRQRIAQPGVV
jgi:hypothetical protein